jgi:translocation and assembly module TamB
MTRRTRKGPPAALGRLLAVALAAVLALAAAFAPPPAAAQQSQDQAPQDQAPQQQSPEDQGVIAGFVSRLLSTPTSQVTIGAVEGALSSQATVTGIVVSDPEGPWLTIDRVTIDWRRAALLRGAIDVTSLAVGRVEIARPPLASPEGGEPGPILPELPVRLEVGRFTLAELALGAPLLGEPALIEAEGSARLGPPAEGLQADLSIRRRDWGGAAGLRLSFVPDGERLELALRHAEPPGGVLARLAGLPGLPAVTLDLAGAGTLDDWTGRLAFDGGQGLGASGGARIRREDGARRFTLDVDATIAALLPPAVAAVYPGLVALDGDIGFPDAGGVALRSVRVVSGAAQATLDGALSAAGMLDLRAAVALAPDAAALGAFGLRRLDRFAFEGAVTGPIAGPSFRGRIELANVAEARLAVGGLSGEIALAPSGGGYAFDLSAEATGVAPADPDLARALGPTVGLDLYGAIDAAGIATFREARLASPHLALRYDGRLGPDLVEGALALEASDLAPLSGLAGVPLGGAARVTAAIAGDPSAGRLSATLGGETTDLTLGDPRLDAALGGRVDLAGVVETADGAIAARGLRLASPLLDLGVDGRLDPAGMVDVTTRLVSTGDAAAAAALGLRRLDRLAFEGVVRGPVGGPAVRGTLDLSGIETPLVTLSAVAGAFSADPAPGEAGRFERGRYALTSDLRVEGLAVALPGVTEAIGRDFGVRLRASLGEDGVALVDQAELVSDTLSLSYRGALGPDRLDGRVEAEIRQLQALSRLAGRSLGGRARLSADLSGSPAARRLDAAIAGRTAGLRFGDPRLDRLLGDVLALSGGVRFAAGALAFETLRGAGRGLEATLDGRLSILSSDLSARLTLLDLALLDPRLGGRAEALARYRGGFLDSVAEIAVAAPEATALGRPVRGFALNARIDRPFGAPAIALTGSGQVGGRPLAIEARAEAATGAEGTRWRIEPFSASLGSTSLSGRAGVSPDRLVEGGFTLRAADLDDLSPIALQPLSGAIDATIEAGAAGGRQRLAVKAAARSLSAAGARVTALDADVVLDNVFGRIAISGDATAGGLAIGGESFERIALSARAGASGSAVSVSARARGFTLSGEGEVRPGPPVAVRLERFSATRDGRRIALAAPATLTLEDGGVRTEALALASGRGRATFAGRFGRTLDAQMTISRLPLSILRVFAPTLAIDGALDGEARLEGPAAAPRGPFRLSVAGLSIPEARAAGLPALAVTAEGALEGERARLAARIRGGRTVSVELSGAAPFSPSGALDISARGTLDAAVANARLAASGQRLRGRIAFEARIGGAPAAPRITGSARLSGGRFDYPALGLSLQLIEGRARLAGDAVIIERLTAEPRGGGSLSANGRIGLSEGLPATLAVTAARARLVDAPLARLLADLDLAIAGPLASAPRISGRVDVRQLDLRVPDRLPSASEPLRDARHVDPPPQTRARLEQARRQEAASRASGAAPFRAALDLAIEAPARIFLRGRGIDAELGGAVRITGTSLSPEAAGGFELRRGRLSILTQRLDFRRGRIIFAPGDFIPDLDLLAETRAAEVTARIAVTGPATRPEFAFSSSPALPQDEVLARLLFARAASGLSPFQAIQLAQAVAQLSGQGGPDAFEAVRRGLGVDDLDVGLGENGPTLGLSRAISDRVRLNARTGARPEDSAVGVDIDLTRQLRARSEIRADGGASVGVGAEIEY